MAQTAEAFWRDAAVAPTEPAGAGGDGEPVPTSVRAITRSAPDPEPDVEPKWCIDDGRGISVLPTNTIRAQLAAGQLDPNLKVWRDGMPYWLRLDEVIELRPDTPAPSGEDTPHSHIRRCEQPESEIIERPTANRVRGGTLPGLAPIRELLKTLALCLLILLSGTAVGFVVTALAVNAIPASAQLESASGPVAERSATAVLRAAGQYATDQPTADKRTATIAAHRRWLYGSRW